MTQTEERARGDSTGDFLNPHSDRRERGKPMSRRSFHRYRWDPALVAAGFEAGAFKVHDLRDTCVNMLAAAHWSMADTADFIGHQSSSTTERFYRSQFRIARRQKSRKPDEQISAAAAEAGYESLTAHDADREAAKPLMKLYIALRSTGAHPSRAELLERLREQRAA